MADQQLVLAHLLNLIDQVIPGARRHAPMIGQAGGFAVAVPGVDRF